MRGFRVEVCPSALLGLTLMAAGGCATTGPAAAGCPDWTHGKPPAAYPTERFLVGLGIVPSAYDAARGEGPGRAAAQADIARQLLSSVQSRIVIDEHGTNQTSSLSVTEQDRITTSLVGPGARAVDRCWDWKTTTFYLLAVLDKKEAAARVRTDIDAANKRGASELAAAEAAAAGDPLAAVGPMGRALVAGREVQTQSAVLRALAAVDAPAPFASDAKLGELAQKIRARTRVLVAIDDPDLRSKIADRVTNAQLEATSDPSQAAVRITAAVETMRLERSAALGQFVAKVRASVQMARVDGGAVMGSTAREGSNGGPTEDVARRRAVADAARALMPAIDGLLSPLSISSTPAAPPLADGGAARP